MEEPEFTTENIEKALYQLYYDPSPTSKDAAQRWLTKAQRASQAWKFAWELLQPEKAAEVQYFGASSLISKINGSWNDIPEADIPVLRERIFELLFRFCSADDRKIVLTRICVALSTFIFKCAVKNLWPSALSNVIEKLKSGDGQSNASEEQRCLALLEILTVLPEEHLTSNLESHKKAAVSHLLKSSFKQVKEFLQAIFENDTAKSLKQQVIRCLGSWMGLGLPLIDCESMLLSVFQCLDDEPLFDVSIECLNVAFCSPTSYDYPNTIKKFIPIVLSLKPKLNTAIKEQDADTILGLTKLVCALSENQTRLILNTFPDPEYGLGLIHMVMECTSVQLQYPIDENSSPISFTFWYSLQDDLQALPVAESAELRNRLLPFFYQLIDNLIKKSSYPKDNSYDSWTSDEKEQHRIYRIDISDTLMYVLEMLGINVLVFIFNKLQLVLQESASAPDHLWHDVEACLFGIHSVVEMLSECQVSDFLPLGKAKDIIYYSK